MEIRRRVELAHSVMSSGKIQSSGSYCHIPFDKGVEKFNEAVIELEIVQLEVDRIQGIKNAMEQEMVKFEGLANVVMYKRIVENKTYRDMAPELGYSEGYLRRYMSQRGNKEVTQSTKAS
ncbi:hypothetical protein D3C75_1089620 [compost metagenome]